ncbi:MAG TPA: hypothetical protein ENI87_01550 [bacterium]|nr:hypothetical protein [bacterium]
MKGTASLHLLWIVALGAPLLAFWPQGQDPDAFRQHLEKAISARRYGIRLAAARKLGAGGDAAIAAIRAFTAERGRNALPSHIVDAIADGTPHTGQQLEELLRWAADDSFYWRAQAMRGLALRATGARDDDDALARLRATFTAYRDDPAWLTRTHARLGLALAGDDVATITALPEPDPRARVRLTRLLLEHRQALGPGVLPPLQPLFDALADERTFLGTPWGARLGQEASRALKGWLGDDYPTIAGGDRTAAIAALKQVAEARSGQRITPPPVRRDAAVDIAGGIEILSCKLGDQFVQWTADGRVLFGIDGSRAIDLPPAKWSTLSESRTRLALQAGEGEVVCDKLRIRMFDPETHVDIAPGALPAAAADWLKRLAQDLEEAGEAGLAARLDRGLEQFVRR